MTQIITPKIYYNWAEKERNSLDDEDLYSFDTATAFPSVGYINDYVTDENKKVSKIEVLCEEVRGTRSIKIYTWWFENKPFGVECIDPSDSKFYCTNKEQYLEAERYLLSLLSAGDNFEVYDENCILNQTANSYKCNIEDIFNLDKLGNKVPFTDLLKKGDEAVFYYRFDELSGVLKTKVRVKIRSVNENEPWRNWKQYSAEVIEWLEPNKFITNQQHNIICLSHTDKVE